MMNHYTILECYMPDDQSDIARIKAVYIKGLGSWRIGRVFEQMPPDPIVVKIKEGYPETLKEFYNNDALVMTKRLYKALIECGVENMAAYPCVISNDETGFSTEDYIAVNLIGLVHAQDVPGSHDSFRQEDLIDSEGVGLNIDNGKAAPRLMFRLAENTSAIVVHQSVKDALLAKGFDTDTKTPTLTLAHFNS